jgi:RNA polymerase sigma factor (sigma-70 family)
MDENAYKYKDEELLILSLKKPSLFEVLVDRYQNDFLRAALKIVKSPQEAEDIVQESFVKIYFNAGRFKIMEGAGFKSWAYKIVRNTSLNHYKKLKREREAVFYINNADLYSNPNPGDNGLETKTEAREAVTKLLPELPDNLRGVFRKYYLEDKSQKDIAKEEGVSLASIKMKLFRARKLFKKVANNNKNLLYA